MGGRPVEDNPFIGLGIRKCREKLSCAVPLDVARRRDSARRTDSGPVGRVSSDGGYENT